MISNSNKQQSKASNVPTAASAQQNDDKDDDVPEDVRRTKEKLERKTGKKYKYRSPKKDLPSVGELLKMGKTEKSSSWNEFPIFVVVMFLLSFGFFYILINNFDTSNSRTPKTTVPLYQRQKQQQQQRQKRQNLLKQEELQQQQNRNDEEPGVVIPPSDEGVEEEL